MKAILQVLPSLVSGGVERGVIDIARAQRDAGFMPVVASSGGPMVSQLDDIGARHITLPLAAKSPWGIYGNIARLRSVIEQYDIALVHARSRAPAWSGYYAARQAGVPFITTFHGTYSTSLKHPAFAPLNMLKKQYNAIMARGERVIAVSEFIRDKLLTEYAADPSRVRVIHRGADMQYFDPDAVTDERMQICRAGWKLANPLLPVILMPGRITRWKGQEFLLRALSRLEDFEFYCIIAGAVGKHDDYMRLLKSKVVDYGLERKVKFVGPVADMPAAYKLSDVVVSASLEPEAFGRIAIEAGAMGKPVVATNIGGSRETIIHKETGRLVSPYTTQEMAEAIARGLVLKDEQRRELAPKIRRHIAENFSLEKMCSATISLYEELLTSP